MFTRLSSRSLVSPRHACVRGRSFASASVLRRDVDRAGVLGAGQMGLGIAVVIANVAKTPVTLVDAHEAALKKGESFMNKLL